VLDKDGALALIPHQISDSGHIVVSTMVNGEGPFDFALDTGASISVVFERGIREGLLVPTTDERVRVQGMTGSGSYPVVSEAQIQVGDETWAAARLALLPGTSPVASRIDGILGVDFMSRYAVAYSQEDQVIRLYPRELVRERSYHGWNSVSLFELRIADGNVKAFAFEMTIGGERIPTMFDLGANTNLMNRRAALSFGIRPRRSRSDAKVDGAFGATIVATELFVWQPWVGDTRWQRSSFLVADFPIFEALNLDKKPAAIAGTSLLEGRDFIIDFAGRRLLVTSRK
jgi:predicted aspartyl protease